MSSRLALLILLTVASAGLGWIEMRRGRPVDTPTDAGSSERVTAPVLAAGATSAASADAAGAPPTSADDDEDEDDDPPVSEAEHKNREAVVRAGQEEFAAAADLLREARRLEPDNDLYRTNLQAVLINGGFADVRAEHFPDAITRFMEALKLGDRGEIRRGLGYAYFRSGNPDLARTHLERAVDLGAGDAETLLTLGRIYLDRHDQAKALPFLEKAIAAGADSPGLADTIARLKRDADAEAGYQALGSSHFVIKIEGRDDTPAARLVLNALEDAYRRVGARFAYYPLDRLEVVLYPDQTFREVTGSPHWSGGIYDGRIKLPVGGLARGSERLARTVRHEYAHAAIVTLSKGKAPVWLNEGLAQVAEESDDQGRTNRLRMAVAEGTLLPLADLEGGFTRFDRDQASLAYSQAYFAAKYLLDQKGGYNVRRLLEAMATADDTDAAFRSALAMPYAEFERHLLAALGRAVG